MLHVVGSAAVGKRRHIGGDLPLARGKTDKAGTRSDIDYLVPTSREGALILTATLPDLAEHGTILGKHDPAEGPAILFRPNRPPQLIPSQSAAVEPPSAVRPSVAHSVAPRAWWDQP